MDDHDFRCLFCESPIMQAHLDGCIVKLRDELLAENTALKTSLAQLRAVVEEIGQQSHDTHCNWFDPNSEPCNCIVGKAWMALDTVKTQGEK